MAFAYPPTRSSVAERSEQQLARLVYEVLDAHSDTERLVRERPSELQWRAHLSYRRDLQRVGRETLAMCLEADGSPIDDVAMTDLPLTGGCNCGAVRFEVSAPLVAASYCHSGRRQRRSGAAASPNAHPAPGAFRIVKGEDRLRVSNPDDGGEKRFCEECGSSLFGRNQRHADPIGIRMGTIDEYPGIRPSVRQFVSSAAPWEPIPDDGLPRHPESRPTSRSGASRPQGRDVRGSSRSRRLLIPSTAAKAAAASGTRV
jgi:hypothetical protein